MHFHHHIWEIDAWRGEKPGSETESRSSHIVLSSISILPFDNCAAEEYGKVRAELKRNGTPIGPLDILIAGHARSGGLVLGINNTREFCRVKDLTVEDWTKE